MEVSSTNKEDESSKLNMDMDDAMTKENKIEVIESTKERSPIDDDTAQNTNITYDEDDEDSSEDIAVITKTSANVDLSPAKNMFSIKTISNTQIHSNYKISKTAIDLEHPGNINGVPTIDYDLSKLTDECKPWKKPGADVSDFFNYGFTEETWLLYCEKQKALRLSHENSAIKTLSGLSNFGYNLSGSHMHLGYNRLNQKNSKGGLIDVIGCQQNGEFKNKHIDMGMSNKISTIPVQTGHMNSNQNQSGNYMSGLTNQAISSNLLNPIMSALAMGMIPNGTNVSSVLGNQQNMPIDTKISQYNSMDGGGSRNFVGHNNWGNSNLNYDRPNSADSMHSHEDYNEKKAYVKTERNSRREEPRRYRSRERRDKSVEKRRRSRSRERGHDGKYSRSKRNRSPDESRRHKKHSREKSKDRVSSTESSKKRRAHRSTKKHRQSKSRSQESRKDRRHRHKSPEKHQKEGNNVDIDKSESIADHIKKEKEAAGNS